MQGQRKLIMANRTRHKSLERIRYTTMIDDAGVPIRVRRVLIKCIWKRIIIGDDIRGNAMA